MNDHCFAVASATLPPDIMDGYAEGLAALTKLAHPAAAVFPLLPLDEFRAFLADIAARGQLEPIVIDEHGLIIDGRNRWLAMTLLGRQPIVEIRAFTETSIVAFVVSRNIHRRHLSASERAMLGARLRQLADEPGNFPVTQEEAATAAGVDVRSVRDAETLLRVHPELAAHVEDKSLSLNGAKALAEVPPAIREDALTRLRAGDRAGNKKIVRATRAAVAKKRAPTTMPATYAALFAELDALPRYLSDSVLRADQIEQLRKALIVALNRLPDVAQAGAEEEEAAHA